MPIRDAPREPDGSPPQRREIPALRPLLVVKTGTAIPSLRRTRGDFEDWIVRGMDIEPERVRVANVVEGEPLPDPAGLAGVAVTGSASMVTDAEPWSERTAEWLVQVIGSATPLLGICYGHQLMARALGGQVGRNPQGRQMGTVEIELAPAAKSDPLFGEFSGSPRFQVTHLESVLGLPPAARLLASTAQDPHYAFAVGEVSWGVQFHPEFDAEVMREYLDARRDLLVSEGIDPDALKRGTAESPQGPALLRRFRELLRD